MKKLDNILIRMIKLWVLAIVLFVSGSVAAQNENYEALAGPYGGGLNDMLRTANGKLLGAASGIGVLVSEDNGASWAPSNSGITSDFNAMDFEIASNGKIFLLTSSRLYVSSDNGSSWVLVAADKFYDARILKIAPNGYFFITSYSQVFRSTDSGKTWPAGASSDLARAITGMHITGNGTIFLSTVNNVFRSTAVNNVATFTELGVSTGLGSSNCQSITQLGTDLLVTTELGPYKSSNNGDLWTSFKDPGVDYFGSSRMIAVGTSVFLILPNSNKLFKTINGGATWTTLSFPTASFGTMPQSLRSFVAESESILYAAFYGLTTMKSIDGGVNWSEISNGITALIPSDIEITDNGRLLYATYSQGLRWSVDDGNSWDYLSAAPLNVHIKNFMKVGSTIYAYGGGIVKTSNNATSWSVVNPGLCGTYLYNMTHSNETTFFSYSTNFNCEGQGQFLVTSIDAGVSWTSKTITGLTDFSVREMFADESGSTIYFSINNFTANSTEIWKVNASTGAAVKIQIAAQYINDVEYLNGKLYALVNNGKLWISANGGDTWDQKTVPTGCCRLKVISDNTFYILTNYVYISTDGGDSWADTGAFGDYQNVEDIAISASNYAYVAIQNGPVHKSVAPIIPPEAPSNITLLGKTATRIYLMAYDNSANESYFIVEESKGDNQHFDSLYSVGPSSAVQGKFTFASVELDPNTSYFYRVRAVGAAGKSGYSDELEVKTEPQDCGWNTSFPGNRSWTATTLNQSGQGVKTNPAVSIIATSGTGIYTVNNISAYSMSPGVLTGLGPFNVTEPLAANFAVNCNSSMVLTATNVMSNGNGTWDEATNTLTLKWQSSPRLNSRMETTQFVLNSIDPAPASPLNIGAFIKKEGEIIVTWGTTVFAQQYQIQRSTTAGSGFVNVGDPIAYPATLGTDAFNFIVGTTYYYRMIAISNGGSSIPSAEVSVAYQKPLFEALNLSGFDVSTQGVSWIDLDNDGDDDIIAAPFNSPNASLGIFENEGGVMQKIEVPGISDYSGFTDLPNTTIRTIAVGDVNNDGFSDFLSLGSGVGGDLWINKGNMEFERKGLVPPDNSGLQWYAAMADMNNDGRMDLVFSTDNGGKTKMKFFVQNTSGELESYELGEIAADDFESRGASWADIDNDGDQDFFRVNYDWEAADKDYDRLYKNNGDGTFSPVENSGFEADWELSPRTISWADFDNDLDLDVFVGHNSSDLSNMLYKNNGDGTFTRLPASIVSELKPTDIQIVTYGSAWGDIDNDGDLDLAVANSYKSAVYLNDGAGNFTKYSGSEYMVGYDISRSNITFAFGDYDKNGTLDAIGGKSQEGFPTILLKNTLVVGANSKWLEVKLVGTTSNKSGIGARIVITTPDSKKQMRAISSHTGYGTANSLTAHFGLKNQNGVSKIEVFWPSGVYQVISETTAANQIITITEDGTPPAVETLLPANLSTGISVNTQLEITFNESFSAVSGKKIKVASTTDPATILFQADVTTGVKTNNTIVFTISNEFPALTTLGISIDAGAFVDQFGNATAAMPAANWTFTTNDTKVPVITYTHATTVLDKGFEPKVFTVTTTDNVLTTGVTMKHRKISASSFESTVASATVSGASWTVTVPNTFSDDMGFEFYFEATDASGNIGRHPVDAGVYHKTGIRFSSTNSPVIDVPSAGTAASWKIISIPYVLSTTQISSIFSALGVSSKQTWRMLFYDKPEGGTEKWLEYPAAFSTIERGKGYFINSTLSTDVTLTDVLAPSESRDNLFTMNLVKGWNQIGNPYTVTLNWNDIKSFNGNPAVGGLNLFVNGSYTSNPEMLPGAGGFVLAETAITGLKFSFPGQTAGNGRVKEFAFGDLDSESWKVDFRLSDGQIESLYGGVGMHPEASLGYDRMDDFNPPRFINFLEMNFDHPEHFIGRFSRDIVPTSDLHEWKFTVVDNVANEVMITWDNTALQGAQKDLFLLDEGQQVLIDMKETSSYVFNVHQSGLFRVYFGNNLKDRITPTKVALGNVYPNPVHAVATIPFTLPESSSLYDVRLEVFDMLGRNVSTLFQGKLGPGFYRKEWTPESNEAAGIFTYRLRVNANDKSEILSGKLLLKK